MGSRSLSQADLFESMRAPILERDPTIAPTRLAIYRNNHRTSLIEALSSTFPVVRQLVGDRFFDAMAVEYIHNHPPSHALLIYYGRRFSDWLRQFPPVQHLAFLPDVAALEQALIDCQHSADATPVTVDAASTADLMQLRGHPSLQAMRFTTPAVSIWRAHQGPGSPELGHLDLDQPECICLVRPDMDVVIVDCSPQQAQFMADLISGQTVEFAIERRINQLNSLPPLHDLLAAGCFTSPQGRLS